MGGERNNEGCTMKLTIECDSKDWESAVRVARDYLINHAHEKKKGRIDSLSFCNSGFDSTWAVWGGPDHICVRASVGK